MRKDKISSKWVYNFLENLARFTIAEAHILSGDKQLFNDFISIKRIDALKTFNQYKGVIGDYDIYIDRVLKGSKFFTNILSDFDSLIIKYYWESIIKARSSLEIRYKLLENGERILDLMFRIDKIMDSIYPKVLKTVKKSIVKKFLEETEWTKNQIERAIENFAASKVTSLYELKKEIKMHLKKYNEQDLKKFLWLESWFYENRFRNELQNLYTSGLIKEYDFFDIFLKLMTFLNQNIDKKDDEEFLSLIYQWRKEVFFRMDKKERDFYKSFIKKYHISFTHKGSYAISYLEEINKKFKNAIIKFASKKESLNLEGRKELINFIRIIRKRMERYETKINYLKKKKKLKRNFRRSKSKTQSLKMSRVTISQLRYLEKNISLNKLKYKVEAGSLLLSIRRATVFFHMFAQQGNFYLEDAQFLYLVFLVILIDGLMQ